MQDKHLFMFIKELLIFYTDVKILLKINDQNFYTAPDGKKSFIFKTFAYVVSLKFAYVLIHKI